MTARRNDEGAALVLATLLIMVLSTMAVSLIFLSQTETYASMNYRLMSQARYAAESGVHKAINHLLNTYTLPGTVSDPLSNYNLAASPVTYAGQPVVLSAISGVGSNYPVSATASAFNTAAQGTLTVGGYNVQYAATATLLSMQQITTYGAGATSVVQTWRITADGTVSGPRPAQVEVSAILERQIISTHTYAAFATDNGCGALNFVGGSATDSYDSTNMTMVSGHPATQANTGNVGTNGNLRETGTVNINGSLSSPRTGVGACSSGAVDALSQTGGSTLTGGIIQLPQAVMFTPPALPNPLPPTTAMQVKGNSTCASSGLPLANCSGSTGNLILNPNGSPLSLGDVSLSTSGQLHLMAGTYNINSMSETAQATLYVDSGPVILNVVGTGQSTPLDLTGGGSINPSFDPTKLVILYAGTGQIKIAGGTQESAMVYAPNAAFKFTGGGDFYGSVLAATIDDAGGTAIHYDRHLASDFFTLGNYMLSAFTWKKS